MPLGNYLQHPLPNANAQSIPFILQTASFTRLFKKHGFICTFIQDIVAK
jgi:hypothetical protein